MANTKSLSLTASSSQYAYIADASQTGLDLSTSFTLEIKIKDSSFATGTYWLLGKTNSASNKRQYGIYFISDGTNVSFVLFASINGATQWSTVSNNITVASLVGSWNSIVGTFDISNNSNSKIYINKVDQTASNSGTTVSSIYNGDADFTIGARKSNTTWGLFFNGLVDDAGVSKVIRDSTYINSTYDTEITPDANHVGFYKFENNANDSSSSANNLTLVNTPTYSTDVPYTAVSVGTVIHHLGLLGVGK